MDIEPLIGEIGVTAFTFAPYGWALCDGSLMVIRQNTALFSILGVTYGGDGTVTFGLPDLRGRTAVGAGQGPGLRHLDLGETSGVEAVQLTQSQMPAHTHSLVAAGTADSATPAGSVFAPAPTRAFRRAGGGGTFTLATLPPAGGSTPHENRQPFVALHYVIALQGIFPARP